MLFSRARRTTTPCDCDIAFTSKLQARLSTASHKTMFRIAFPRSSTRCVIISTCGNKDTLAVSQRGQYIANITHGRGNKMPSGFTGCFQVRFDRPVTRRNMCSKSALVHRQPALRDSCAYTCLEFGIPTKRGLAIHATSSFVDPTRTLIGFDHRIKNGDLTRIERRTQGR